MSIKNLFADELLSLERNMCPNNTIECVTLASYEPYGVWSYNVEMGRSLDTYKIEGGNYVLNGGGAITSIDGRVYLKGYKVIELDKAIAEEATCGFYLTMTGKMGSDNISVPLTYITNWDDENMIPDSFNFSYSDKYYYVDYYVLIRDGAKYLMNANLDVWLDLLQNSIDEKAHYGNEESQNVFEMPLSKLRGRRNGIIAEGINEENKFKKYNKIELASRGFYGIRIFYYIKSAFPVEEDVNVVLSITGKDNCLVVIKKGQTTSEEVELNWLECFKSVNIYKILTATTVSYVHDFSKLYSPYTIKSAEQCTIERVLEQYKDGRETVKLTAICNIYTKVVVGDYVELWKCRRQDMAAENINTLAKIDNSDMATKYAGIKDVLGNSKQFIVTSAEITYNGAYRQNLDLLEVK